MPVAVVDASAILAILFGEPDASRVVERLGARDLAAPSLLPYEIMNTAATKVRRGEVTRDAAEPLLKTEDRLPGVPDQSRPLRQYAQ